MPRRHHESLGELISTIVFFGVSVTLALAAVDSYVNDQNFKGLGFSIAGLFCFLGGLRFPIARFTDRLSGRKNNEK